MGLLSACVIPTLLCGQDSSEPAIETPGFEKTDTPAAIPAPSDVPYNLIVNRETGLCLEVPKGSLERRTKIEQAKPGDGFHQHWRLIAGR